MKSTPVSAAARTVSRLTLPEASRVGLPPCARGRRAVRPRRASSAGPCCRGGAGRRRCRGRRRSRRGCGPRPPPAAPGGPCGPRRRPCAMLPAAAMWLSLIRKASKRPMRWLVPPPAATAAFSSLRRPGVVLRVSRIFAFGAVDRLDVARGQRRHPGEVAEEVQRGALGGEDRAGRAAGDQHLDRDGPGATAPPGPASRPPPPRSASSSRPRGRARRRRRALSGRSARSPSPRRERSLHRSHRRRRGPRPAPGRPAHEGPLRKLRAHRHPIGVEGG